MNAALPLQQANKLLQHGQWQAALAAYLPLFWYLPSLQSTVWQNVQLAAHPITPANNSVQCLNVRLLAASETSKELAQPYLTQASLAKYLPAAAEPAYSELKLSKLPLQEAELKRLCYWVAMHPAKQLVLEGAEPQLALVALLHQLCWQSQVWWHLPQALNLPVAKLTEHWHFSNSWLLSSGQLLSDSPLMVRYLKAPFDAFFAARIHQTASQVSQVTPAQLNELLALFPCYISKPSLLPASLTAATPTLPIAGVKADTQASDICPLAVAYRFQLDQANSTQISGWAVDTAEPERTFDISIELNGHATLVTRNDRPRNDLLRQGISNGLGGFSVQLPACLNPEREYSAVIRLPDGSQSAPIAFNLPNTGPLPVPRCFYTATNTASVKPVTIIMPVFNALADVKRGLKKLNQHTTGAVRLVIINDASTDTAVKPYLDGLQLPHTTVLHNERNLGFSATVNKGIDWAGSDDVVLLNSDARVTPNWLTLLQEAAYSNEHIATVTPFSDRAGAFSAPNMGNENALPFGVSEDEFAVAVQRNSSYLYPVVPTGNGFCLYIKRSCLNAIGLLDAEAFPRGYGEENDFCMRAQRKGWQHIIADSCYVFHERSQSFGEEKHALMQAGRAVVDSRYPEYSRAIQTFREQPALAMARFKVFEATEQALKPVLPRALFVVSTQTGGTPQTNNDLMQALASDIDCWLLRCDSQQLWLWQRVGGELILRANHVLTEAVNAITHRSHEYDATLSRWLRYYRFNLVHIRHLAWHSLSLPKLVKESGAAVVMSLHDYYSLCPTVQLLDNNGVYCQANCTKSAGDCQQALWPASSLPPLKNGWVGQWQQQFNAALSYCDVFITTSNSAKATLQSKLPVTTAKPFYVIGHGRDFERLYQLAAPYQAGKPLRIVVPGNITESKGLKLIEQLLALDTAGLFEFHILGQHKFSQPHPRLVLHGPYQRQDFASHIERIAPHIGAVWSIWNETWCHTLTELWACGVPVSVLPYDTVATRVTQSGAGWVMPQHAEQLYHTLQQLIANADDISAKTQACVNWQQSEAQYNHTAFMASAYQVAYQQAWHNHQLQNSVFTAGKAAETTPRTLQKQRIALVCPALDRQHANPSTHIRLWQPKRFNLHSNEVYLRLNANELLAAVTAGQLSQAIIQRQAVPASVWPQLQKLVEQDNLQYQLDLDDNLLQVPASKDHEGFYQHYRPVLQGIMQHADLITVASEGLQQQLAKLGFSAKLQANTLSNKLWRTKPASTPASNWQPSRSLLYMGSPSHDDDFNLILPALSQVAAIFPDFRLVVVGVFASLQSLPNWVTPITIPTAAGHYPEFVAWFLNLKHGCCAAIAPLEDTEFNAGKSPLKILDYAAIGLPVLASDHNVYRAIASEAPAVTLVENSSSSWFNAVVQQLEKPAALVQQQRAAMQQWVFNEHCQ